MKSGFLGKPRELIKETLETILQVAVILLIFYVVCWPFKIEGSSMETELYQHDRIVISRASRLFSAYKHGDIVVCKVDAYGKEEVIVKRIVGLPNETIEIKDGKVYLENVELNEPYLGNISTHGNLKIKINPGEFFVLGDNREVSLDSRQLGNVSKQKIVGKVIAKWYPFFKFKTY